MVVPPLSPLSLATRKKYGGKMPPAEAQFYKEFPIMYTCDNCGNRGENYYCLKYSVYRGPNQRCEGWNP